MIAEDIIYNIITSGKHSKSDETLETDEMARYIVFNIILILGVVYLLAYGMHILIADQNIPRAVSDFIMASLCVVTIFLLRTKLPFIIAGCIVNIAFGILCSLYVISGEVRGFASLWIYVFPLLSIFTLGIHAGLILSILLLCSILVSTLIPGLAGISYSVEMASRLAGVYVLVTIFSIVYEQVRIIKERNIVRLSEELRAESDEISAMKDHLKLGIFLMDKDYIIQPSYSAALETILGADKLQGKKFLDFLSPSMKEKDLSTMKDYLDMVINRSFDEKMLDEINPISEFRFTAADEFKSKKNLRTSFAAVDRGYGVAMIQATLEDITAQVNLQKELNEAAAKQDEEMQYLFQVINSGPRILDDFIEDAEYEVDKIHGNLKNTAFSPADVVISIYQGVHAIKSNALILGFDNFSVRLHEFENKIKDIQDSKRVSLEDTFRISVELEIIMQEKEKYLEASKKIDSYMSATVQLNDQSVFVETLRRACEKAGKSEGKEVKFIVTNLNESALEYAPRRQIKEMLTQLIRNSIAHGIESPDKRIALGKESEGYIRLSIKWEDNQIRVRLSDDGAGIDFDKIREKALRLKLFSEEEAENLDRDALLQVIFNPGFSTTDTVSMIAGRGVGLDLVQDRIRELNGSIKIKTKKDKGTVFYLYIPVDAPNQNSAASETGAPGEAKFPEEAEREL